MNQVQHRLHQLRARAASEDGAATLELLIVIPGLLLFFAGVLHFAILATATNLAHSAATSAANTARLYDGTDSAATAAALEIVDTGQGWITSPGVFITRGGNTLTVTVTGTSPSFIPLGTGITETVTVPLERLVE